MSFTFNPLTGKFDYYKPTANPGYILDAPSDGTLYGRKNASWVASSVGSVLDAQQYNKNATDGLLLCSQYDPSAT